MDYLTSVQQGEEVGALGFGCLPPRRDDAAGNHESIARAHREVVRNRERQAISGDVTLHPDV